MKTRRVRADGGWMADDEPHLGAVHIWPVGDVFGHDLEDPEGGCLCGPLTEPGVVIHNSYDGREEFEDLAGALRDLQESVRGLGREIWHGVLRPIGETVLCVLVGLLAYAMSRAIDDSENSG